jgi:hypothetical protein
MKSKFLIPIIILLVIIVGLTGGIYYWKNKQAIEENNRINKENQQAEDADKNIKNNTEFNNKIYAEAISAKNADKCKDIVGNEQQDLCIKLLAIGIENKELCNKITNQKINKECEDMVNYAIATRNQDIDLCASINDSLLSSSCTLNIISQKNYSKEECEIIEGGQKDLCLSTVLYNKAIESNNPELCESIPMEDNISECLGSIYSKQDHISFCDLISENLRPECIRSIANRLAVGQKNVSICAQIKDAEYQNECKTKVDLELDPDNDGLVNYRENSYNTDPKNPDTDGDGYSDGDEVKRGYNPKGEGKL